jgi:hypothetical protein
MPAAFTKMDNREESIPPLKKVPKGASEIKWLLTAAVTFSCIASII